MQGLSTYFHHKQGLVKAVNKVSLRLEPGSVLGLVGESGCGKTMTALSILNLVPDPGKIVEGKILFGGKDLLQASGEEMRKLRGKEISMVFQDATAGLNPIINVGTQIEEMITSHLSISKREARRLSAEALARVGMPDPERTMSSYTFQLSGGMCQRVMVATAMVLNPKVLIADEATTSLDVTLQADILVHMRKLKEQGTAILLITHDLGIIAQMADRVAMMYAGYIVEQTETATFFQRPMHPYSWGMMRSIPRLDDAEAPLVPLPGSPPNLLNMEDDCPFLPRCNKATNDCRHEPMPPLEEIDPDHQVACYNHVKYDWD